MYEKYGKRGIGVCERWLKFENFFADMGHPPVGPYSVERKNNDKGYSPDNCKWALPPEQSRNTRRNVRLTVNGRTQVLMDWAIETGIPHRTLSGRFKLGWTPEEIIGLAPRPSDRLLTLNDESHTLTEWARLRGIKHQTLSWRLRNGKTLAEALISI